MVKKSKKVKEQKEVGPYVITAGSIGEDLCKYSFEVTKGNGLGDKHKVDGTGIIDDDLRNAFRDLNVHLASADDVFDHAGVETRDIEKLRNHELAALYEVTGFKIKGSAEDEAIILIGSKHVDSVGGRMDLETPKILMGEFSAYEFYQELKHAADVVRDEIAQYKEGKYTAVEKEERADPTQLNAFTPANDDLEFEAAKK